MLEHPVNRLRNVVHHYIEVNFVRLVTLGVESVAQVDYVRVVEFLHYLEFTVLVPFVLVYLFDGDYFACFGDGGLWSEEGNIT